MIVASVCEFSSPMPLILWADQDGGDSRVMDIRRVVAETDMNERVMVSLFQSENKWSQHKDVCSYLHIILFQGKIEMKTSQTKLII